MKNQEYASAAHQANLHGKILNFDGTIIDPEPPSMDVLISQATAERDAIAQNLIDGERHYYMMDNAKAQSEMKMAYKDMHKVFNESMKMWLAFKNEINEGDINNID